MVVLTMKMRGLTTLVGAAALLLMRGSAVLPADDAGAADHGLEAAVKATYIYKFGPFVEWPSSAFETHSSTANGDEARRHLAPNVRIFPYAQTVTPRSPRANQPPGYAPAPASRDAARARPHIRAPRRRTPHQNVHRHRLRREARRG